MGETAGFLGHVQNDSGLVLIETGHIKSCGDTPHPHPAFFFLFRTCPWFLLQSVNYIFQPWAFISIGRARTNGCYRTLPYFRIVLSQARAGEGERLRAWHMCLEITAAVQTHAVYALRLDC